MADSSIHQGPFLASSQYRPMSSRTRNSLPGQYQVLLDWIRSSESDSGRGILTIGLTSTIRREGVTTLACNLALQAACDGLRVLLLDANCMHPSLQRIFQLPQAPGLADLIAGHEVDSNCIHDLSARPFKSLPKALKHSIRRLINAARSTRTRDSFEIPRLSVLTIGSMKGEMRDSSPAEFDRAGLLENVYADFDLVVVDLPAVSENANCPIAVSRLDGVILVLEAEATSDRAVQKCLQQLRLRRANILGVALNKSRRRWTSWVNG